MLKEGFTIATCERDLNPELLSPGLGLLYTTLYWFSQFFYCDGKIK